jgi:hypothetical protein
MTRNEGGRYVETSQYAGSVPTALIIATPTHKR